VTHPSIHPGLPIIGEIESPGYLEGGDFIAMGQDLALIGIGLRRCVRRYCGGSAGAAQGQCRASAGPVQGQCSGV